MISDALSAKIKQTIGEKALPGEALRVFLYLLFKHLETGSLDIDVRQSTIADEMKLKRQNVGRALAHIEKAGLIKKVVDGKSVAYSFDFDVA